MMAKKLKLSGNLPEAIKPKAKFRDIPDGHYFQENENIYLKIDGRAVAFGDVITGTMAVYRPGIWFIYNEEDFSNDLIDLGEARWDAEESDEE